MVMPRPALVIAALCAVVPMSPARSAVVCDPDAVAVQNARNVAQGIVTADNARDLERVLAFYATDAILMPPGEEPVTDLGSIRKRYESLFSEYDPQIEAQIDEACADGALAFVRGRNGGRLVSRKGGGTRPLDDVYLMVLRREPDNAWRITHLIWHPARPPAPDEECMGARR